MMEDNMNLTQSRIRHLIIDQPEYVVKMETLLSDATKFYQTANEK